jgi:hypothetical protein
MPSRIAGRTYGLVDLAALAHVQSPPGILQMPEGFGVHHYYNRQAQQQDRRVFFGRL